MPQTNPRMTRAHFCLVADVINTTPHERLMSGGGCTSLSSQQYQHRLAAAMADALAATNPNFRRETFLRACGVDV